MNLFPAYEKWHEETLAIGKARGRSLERLSIARTMLQEGAAIALITKVTGFSAKEIEQLSLEQ
ncbi:MAG: hypothetical protein HC860_04410 [Alkalinema sp. RU_4_3]|nr:hypothetical protein [Alkalinema sp. RU_4_3]